MGVGERPPASLVAARPHTTGDNDGGYDIQAALTGTGEVTTILGARLYPKSGASLGQSGMGPPPLCGQSGGSLRQCSCASLGPVWGPVWGACGVCLGPVWGNPI